MLEKYVKGLKKLSWDKFGVIITLIFSMQAILKEQQIHLQQQTSYTSYSYSVTDLLH